MKAFSGVPLLIIDPKAVGIGVPPGKESGRMVADRHESVRYAITNLTGSLPANELDAPGTRRFRWLKAVNHWIAVGVNYIQLREKTLDAGELFALAETAVPLLQAAGGARPRLLINGRPDIAAAARADGVHLTAKPGEVLASQVRRVFEAAGLPTCTVSVSCHTLGEVRVAREQEVDLILFGPVFEKRVDGRVVVPGTGLDLLRQACEIAGPTRVLGLGGISADTAQEVAAAGAVGVAGIRLFSPS